VGVREPPPAAAAAASAAGAGPRRFEFREGRSDKFWEVSVCGAEVTVRYGRAGAPGRTQVKSFPDEAAAAEHAAALIAEKTGKGYQEAR
jgi:predicted DNA-binding WGR domain protein